MNFNVYIDQSTGERLARLARQRRTTRNALIREALQHLLDRASVGGWPAEVLDFEGLPKTPRFEARRRALRAPSKDPLA